jgi:hypothetical protein
MSETEELARLRIRLRDECDYRGEVAARLARADARIAAMSLELERLESAAINVDNMRALSPRGWTCIEADDAGKAAL